MDNTEELLESLYDFFSYIFLLWNYTLYYLAIKKCFWKRQKSRIKLFFVTFLVNPYTFFLITTLLGPGLVFFLNANGYITLGTDMDENMVVLICMFVSGIIMILLIFLFSNLVAKWLNAPNRELVMFISLMQSVLIALSEDTGAHAEGNERILELYIIIIQKVGVLLASILLYRFVISSLATLTNKRREIDSKLFVLPPALFVSIFDVFLLLVVMHKRDHSFLDGTCLIVFFSFIILLLFIWSFYIIIRNINASNEAIEAKELAAEMAVAEARIEEDLSIAKQIQTSALPCIFPPFPEKKEFELYASMNAAKEVGGDFYDFYMLGQDTLGFLIADVSGKGIPAAMFMMTGKTIIKSLAENDLASAEVFTIANEKLCEGNDAELFITAWLGYLELDTGLVHVANAGHNPPVLIHDGKAEYVVLKPGLMLAGMEGIIYNEQTVQMKKDDILFLYTDGVTEAMDTDENLYGEERLIELLSFGENYPEPSDENGIAGAICEMVAEDIERFAQGAERSDDITMLCVRYIG